MTPHTDPRTAFEALWDAHYPAVLAYALRRTDPESARDVAAEAFTAAWRRLPQAPAEPRLWLLGFARGAMANHLRGQRRRDALARRVAEHLAHTDGRAPDLGLADAMARLGPRDVEALLLTAWEGLSHAEAARVVGCTTAAFAVRLHRARGRLARAMSSASDASRPVIEEESA